MTARMLVARVGEADRVEPYVVDCGPWYLGDPARAIAHDILAFDAAADVTVGDAHAWLRRQAQS
jgi:hypothetical protein